MKLEEIIEKRINEANSLDELVFILENLLAQHSVWENGRLLSIRQLVDIVDGLRIEIYHNEHSPPHFHVKASGINASFYIQDCKLLKGSIGGRERKVIEWWFSRTRSKLIKIWNETRPSDCQVGLILE